MGKAKKNFEAQVVKQAGERTGYNLYIQVNDPLPILLRLETIKTDGVISLRLSNACVANQAGLTRKVLQMIEDGQLTDFDKSVERSFPKRGCTQMYRNIPEKMRWDGKLTDIEEVEVDF